MHNTPPRPDDLQAHNAITLAHHNLWQASLVWGLSAVFLVGPWREELAAQIMFLAGNLAAVAILVWTFGQIRRSVHHHSFSSCWLCSTTPTPPESVIAESHLWNAPAVRTALMIVCVGAVSLALLLQHLAAYPFDGVSAVAGALAVARLGGCLRSLTQHETHTYACPSCPSQAREASAHNRRQARHQKP